MLPFPAFLNLGALGDSAAKLPRNSLVGRPAAPPLTEGSVILSRKTSPPESPVALSRPGLYLV